MLLPYLTHNNNSKQRRLPQARSYQIKWPSNGGTNIHLSIHSAIYLFIHLLESAEHLRMNNIQTIRFERVSYVRTYVCVCMCELNDVDTITMHITSIWNKHTDTLSNMQILSILLPIPCMWVCLSVCLYVLMNVLTCSRSWRTSAIVVIT